MKIGFVSLGCPKNLVDSEVMMGQLVAKGHELTPHPDQADVLVVNTCSFIDPAKKESVDTILEMAEYKKIGRARKLIVAGCLVERYRGDIRKDMPEVDALIGTNELEGIVAACEGLESDAGAVQPYLYLFQNLGAVSASAPSGNDGQTSRRLLPHRQRKRSASRSYDGHRRQQIPRAHWFPGNRGRDRWASCSGLGRTSSGRSRLPGIRLHRE